MSEMPPKKENCTIERDNLGVPPLDDPLFLFLVGAGSASPSSIMDSEKYQSLIWMKDFFLKRTHSNKIEFFVDCVDWMLMIPRKIFFLVRNHL